MRAFGIALGIILVLILILGGWIWGARGGLITKSQAVERQWGQVQNVYQRRLDLIPNLVAGVDNFMQRQQTTLTDVIAMRQRVIELKGQAQEELNKSDVNKVNIPRLDSISAALSRQLNSFINVVVERYPDIKGEAMYQDFMSELEGTENRIAQERRAFNTEVEGYNVYRQRGVGPLIAGSIFGFPYSREFFKASAEAQTAPSVREAFNQGKVQSPNQTGAGTGTGTQDQPAGNPGGAQGTGGR